MRRLVVAVGLGVFAAVAVRADEGRTPVFQPTSITQPGTYFLTQNISSSGSNVISISTSALVVLDLNGFTLTGTGSTTSGIDVFPGGDAANVVIKNGRVTTAFRGVQYNTQPAVRGRLRLENMLVDVTGTLGEALTASTPANIEIVGCVLRSPATFTVSVYNPNATGTFSGRVIDSRIENLSSAGNSVALALDGLRAGVIRGNVITATSGMAARLDGPNGGGDTIEQNTFAGGAGLSIGSSVGADGNVVLNNNFLSSTGSFCLQIGSSGNRIAGNVVGPGCADGIVFVYNSTLRNLIEGNQIQGNSGCGLRFAFAATNAYRNNMLRGNTGGTVCGVANTDAGGNIF